MKLKSFIKKDFNLMELFRGGAIALGFKFLSVFIGYFFFWLLAKWLGADGVGVFSTAWTILMIGAVFGKIGFDTSIVKFIAGSIGRKNQHHVRPIYRYSITIVGINAMLVAGILYIFAQPISELFFNSAQYTNIVRIIAITVVPLSILNINAESLKALKNITAFSIFQNSSIYLAIILIMLFLTNYGITNKSSIFALSMGTSLLMFISFIVVFSNFRKKLHHNPDKPAYQFNFKKTIGISLPMMLTNSLFLIMSWMDILMLSAFKTDADVGIYNTSLKISAVISIALIAINSIALPKYAELFEKNDMLGFRKVVKQTSFLNFGLSLPVFLLILLVPGFLLGIFGEEFIAGKMSLIILAIGQIFSAFSGSTIHVLNMTGKENAAKNILITTALLNLVLNYLLVPKYGINGAAIATAISTVIWNLLAEISIYRHLKFLTYPLISVRKAKDLRNKIMDK
ncbi:MAG: flippase [Bacteroidales bacterium]|nr:flippase [Bacteroidales bacterium]